MNSTITTTDLDQGEGLAWYVDPNWSNQEVEQGTIEPVDVEPNHLEERLAKAESKIAEQGDEIAELRKLVMSLMAAQGAKPTMNQMRYS